MEKISEAINGTKNGLSKLQQSIFGFSSDTPTAQVEAGKDSQPPIEQVRKIIEKNKDNAEFYAIAPTAWKTIQSMSSADLHGVDPVEIWTYMMALAEQESNYNPKVVNRSSGAFGLFQIMPANFQEWGLSSGRNAGVEEQVRVAAKQLTGYFNYFHRWDLVSVSWFGGASRAVALQKGEKKVANLKDAGGKSIGAYHADVSKRMEKLRQA